jgi:hypothetical protein
MRQVGSSFGSAIIGAVLLTTIAGGLAKGVENSPVIPTALKPSIASTVAAKASDVELSGTDQTDKAEQLSPALSRELTAIAHQASADGARKAVLYTGGFIAIGFLASFTLPYTKDLEAAASKQPTAAH